MRNALFLMLGIFGLGHSVADSLHEESLLRCALTTEDEGLVTFIVTKQGGGVLLKKEIEGTEIARVSLPSHTQVVKWYGSTFIVFDNVGKSGYLLLHYSEKTQKSLIDINLFQTSLRALNTEGPQTVFQCARP